MESWRIGDIGDIGRRASGKAAASLEKFKVSAFHRG